MSGDISHTVGCTQCGEPLSLILTSHGYEKACGCPITYRGLVCSVCDGSGEMPREPWQARTPCPACDGIGVLRIGPATPAAREGE